MPRRLKIKLDRCGRAEGERVTCFLLQACGCNIRPQLCYVNISEYIHEIHNMGGIQWHPVFAQPVPTAVAL